MKEKREAPMSPSLMIAIGFALLILLVTLLLMLPISSQSRTVTPPLTALSAVLSAAPCMGSGARMFCAVPLAVTVGSSSGCACPCSRMAVMAKLTSRMPATAPANRMTPPGPPLRLLPVL